MALRNDKESLSEFGKRLLSMMEQKECTSARQLAEKLLEQKLVVVKQKDTPDADPFKKRDNAIESVEKKIAKHLKSEDAYCLQGEFVKAYCTFFDCTPNYLFGIETKSIEYVSEEIISQKTGLSLDAVRKLMRDADCTGLTEEEQIDHKSRLTCWSWILECNFYENLPRDWVTAADARIKAYQYEAQLKAAEWEKTVSSGPDILDLDMDIEGYRQQITQFSALSESLIRNIGENFSILVKEDVARKTKEVGKCFDKGFMDEARKRHTT